MAYSNTVQAVTPITKFLKWKGKSTDGFFDSYNKETKENERQELSKFIIVDTGFNIAGGTQNPDNSYTGYFSNEIKDFKEKLRVMQSGSGILVEEGYYSNIKDRVKSIGGFLQICITYIDLKDNQLKEFFLKGQAFYDFSEGILKLGQGKVISYDGANLVKGKAFDYNAPKFSISTDVPTEAQLKLVGESGTIVDEYYEGLRAKYSTKDTEVSQEEEAPEDEAKQYAGEPTGGQTPMGGKAEPEVSTAKASIEAQGLDTSTSKANHEAELKDLPFS